jgi:hypothetical protein
MGTMKHEIQIIGGNYYVDCCVSGFYCGYGFRWHFDYSGLYVYSLRFLFYSIRNRACDCSGICIRQYKADRLNKNKFISLLVITGRGYFYKNI